MFNIVFYDEGWRCDLTIERERVIWRPSDVLWSGVVFPAVYPEPVFCPFDEGSLLLDFVVSLCMCSSVWKEVVAAKDEVSSTTR